MGQYHMLVNLDKREFIYSHQLGDGLKAWEQFASGPGGVMSAAVYLMVAPTPRGGGDFEAGPYMGRWHGDRVVWVGDYAEKDDFAPVVVEELQDDVRTVKAIEIHADMVYTLCPTDEEDREGVVSWATEVLAGEDRHNQADLAQRILAAVEAGIWFTNITPQVREVMAGELAFMTYEPTEWGTVSRKETNSSRMTTAMRPDAIIPLPSEEGT